MTDPAWFPAGPVDGEECRPARRAVEELLAAATTSTPAATVLAVSIRDAADLVDSARRRQDPQMLLKATGRLESLIAKWTKGGAGGGSTRPGGADAAARLEALVGSAPDVGDPEES